MRGQLATAGAGAEMRARNSRLPTPAPAGGRTLCARVHYVEIAISVNFGSLRRFLGRVPCRGAVVQGGSRLECNTRPEFLPQFDKPSALN